MNREDAAGILIVAIVLMSSTIILVATLFMPAPNLPKYTSYSDVAPISIEQTSDGGYIILGNDIEYQRVTLIKTDSQGSMQWQRQFNRIGWYSARCVRQTADNGYIILQGSTDCIELIKVDSNGMHQWNKTYTGYGSQQPWFAQSSVFQELDGGYVVGGMKNYHNESYYYDWHQFLMRTDSEGKVIWNRTYGEKAGCSSLERTADGDYLIAGGAALTAGFLLNRVDKNGTLKWSALIPINGTYELLFAFEASDGGYVAVGNTNLTWTPYSLNSNCWFVKTDQNGTILWEKTYGGFEGKTLTNAEKTTDGGYLLAGYGTSIIYGSEYHDSWLIKTYENGSVEWESSYGTSGNGGYHAQKQTSEGGYIVATLDSFELDQLWLIKILVNGSIDWEHVIMFPRPF